MVVSSGQSSTRPAGEVHGGNGGIKGRSLQPCWGPAVLARRQAPRLLCFLHAALRRGTLQGVLVAVPSSLPSALGAPAGSWPWPTEPTAARSEVEPSPLLTCGRRGGWVEGREGVPQAGERTASLYGSAHQGLLAGVPPSAKGANAASGADTPAPESNGWSACRACRATTVLATGCAVAWAKPAVGKLASCQAQMKRPTRPKQSKHCPPAAGGGPRTRASRPQGPARRGARWRCSQPAHTRREGSGASGRRPTRGTRQERAARDWMSNVHRLTTYLLQAATTFGGGCHGRGRGRQLAVADRAHSRQIRGGALAAADLHIVGARVARNAAGQACKRTQAQWLPHHAG